MALIFASFVKISKSGDSGQPCLQCHNATEISILADESSMYDYNSKRGVTLEFS